jgi:multidrug efflux pump subunit AcrA (membrane-fusion protein)
VRITFDKLDPRILPDMGVKVAFLDEAKSAKKGKEEGPAAKAIVPQSVVHGEGTGSYVFAVRDGKLERRAVSLGRQIGSDVEVMAGLSAGDQLVVHGPDTMRDGERVQIRQ